jgi:hypothetical protein
MGELYYGLRKCKKNIRGGRERERKRERERERERDEEGKRDRQI